jgi:hypothetical protein
MSLQQTAGRRSATGLAGISAVIEEIGRLWRVWGGFKNTVVITVGTAALQIPPNTPTVVLKRPKSARNRGID